MVKDISILGSTGSIGTQTLEVVDRLGSIKVWGLSTNSRIDLLEQQIRKYRPVIAAVMDEKSAQELKHRVRDTDTTIVTGQEGLISVSTVPQAQMVVTSVVGIIGLIPTLEAIRAGKHIALANKETLVTAGEIVMAQAKENNVSILPVDSEHSAIFQCLQGNREKKHINKLILTASGGPFLNRKKEELTSVTPSEALKHPKWNMGKKISIDSATLMNKGLEVIEAKWLFDMDVDQIQVVIHPQSIIHSMVEYVDGSIIAQLGLPDMKLPIQYALSYPDRIDSKSETLNLFVHNTLTFMPPDITNFKCLKLAYHALEKGGTMPVVLNAVNELAVELFLQEKIHFSQIAVFIEEVMNNHKNILAPSLDNILEVDNWAREYVRKELQCTGYS